MTIAVIIPAHNEAEYIPQILATVRQQTRLPDEIAVVCDRCTDDTEACARIVFDHFPPSVRGLTVLADCGDIAGSRNAGILATTSEILVCVDADTLLHPDLLRHVEEAVCNGAFFGGFRMVADTRFRRTLWQTLLYRFWLGGINLSARFLKNFVGTGCFFRRVGLLYDANWGWGEDIEFSGRARKVARERGESVVYLSQVTLAYCDRRFLERGYLRELQRRLTKGIDHLRREQAKTRTQPAPRHPGMEHRGGGNDSGPGT